jgi:hypothetical protein
MFYALLISSEVAHQYFERNVMAKRNSEIGDVEDFRKKVSF